MALFDWEIHYEVQVLDGGRWTIVAASRDAAEARETALRLLARPEFAGVRVVRELRERREDRVAACVLLERVRPRLRRRFPLPARAAPRPAALVAARPVEVAPVPGPPAMPGAQLPLAAILAGAGLGIVLLVLAVAG